MDIKKKREISQEYITSFRQHIGSRVKEFRKEKGIKQFELAESLNISEGTMAKIESGKWISLEMLIKLSIKLDFYIFLIDKDSDD